MNLNAWLLTSSLCGAALLSAQGTAAVNVDELIQKHLQARGGVQAIKAVSSLRTTRTVPTIGATLSIVIHKKRPNLYRSEQSAPGRPTVVRILNADGLFEVANEKVTVRPAAMATELRELDGDIDGPLVDYQAKGHTVAYDGTGDEAGVKVHRLVVTLKSGATRRILLDATTFLERKHLGKVTLPTDRVVDTAILLHDYRKVGGLFFPFAIDEERDAMGQTFAFYVDAVDLNVPVDDTLFATPSNVPK